MVYGIKMLNAKMELRSPVYLVERTGISETALPDLVHDLGCLLSAFANWPRHHRQRSSSSNTLLVLLHEFTLLALEELASPPTLPTERARADLQTMTLATADM